ncbi:OmpA family protein [Segatella copri]|uniref:OmpA family protein n=1 Tax=Segatella copri TaxID=165179 RepID=UPI003F8B614D
MKLNKVILSGVVALSCVSASAQEADKTVNVFTPHWYAQAQIGGQYTLGEIGFGKLLSPNAQVGVGYNFNQVVGTRFSLNTWQSKAGQKFDGNTYKWKWNYVAPMVDATFNLTNLFCEYNPDRLVEVGVFGGIGANIAWGNDEAADAQAAILKNEAATEALKYGATPLENLWDGTKTRFVARVGANVDFRVSDRVKLGVELSANTLSDKYNSKKAGNPDWYFNALVGVKVALGETHTTKVIPAPKPVEKIIERIIEKPAPAPAPKVESKVVEENFRRDIFFPIGNSNIAKSQSTKIAEIVEYMKENPDAKITLTGYADKGTGSAAFNDKIAARRAQTVYNTLAAKGVAKSRMIKESKGSRVQPFEENDMNRVTICIAK